MKCQSKSKSLMRRHRRRRDSRSSIYLSIANFDMQIWSNDYYCYRHILINIIRIGRKTKSLMSFVVRERTWVCVYICKQSAADCRGTITTRYKYSRGNQHRRDMIWWLIIDHGWQGIYWSVISDQRFCRACIHAQQHMSLSLVIACTSPTHSLTHCLILSYNRLSTIAPTFTTREGREDMQLPCVCENLNPLPLLEEAIRQWLALTYTHIHLLLVVVLLTLSS